MPGAEQFFPRTVCLETLREASKTCQGCPLYQDATHTVFGKGSATARLFFVGEQPGSEEDLRGEPFVGPSGKVLQQACEIVGLDRSDIYLTNVVKHFKWVGKGERRMHKTPDQHEIAACLPWLEKEVELIKPQVILCLGATAARTVFGRAFRHRVQRGCVMPSRYAEFTVSTVHPSIVLRQTTTEDRERELQLFVKDLGAAVACLKAT